MPEIVLKDWYDKEQTFDRDVIFAANPQGDLEPFTHGVVKPLEISENGTFEAPDGVAGYSPVVANIPAPEIKLQEKTITENGEYTADDGFDGLGKVLVEIAGAGGSAVKYTKGYAKTTSSATSLTINHYLDAIPDIVVVYNGLPTTEYQYFDFAVGFSKAMLDKMSGSDKKSFVQSAISSTNTMNATDTNGIDGTVSSNYATYGGIRNANAESFTIGGNSGRLKTDGTHYHYIAISGLT